MTGEVEVPWWELQALIDLAKKQARYACDHHIIERLQHVITEHHRTPITLPDGADDN